VVAYGEGEKQQIRPHFAKERDDLLTKRRILIVGFAHLRYGQLFTMQRQYSIGKVKKASFSTDFTIIIPVKIFVTS
jgi:hypothetical protein